MDITKMNTKMRFMLLSRMMYDCEYYLGMGNRSNNVLFSKNEKDHIEDMKILYNSLDQKPEWLSLDKIKFYENEMIK